MDVSRDPGTLPLAERFLICQMLVRELNEHMRQTFLPRLSALRHASKEPDVDVVTDQEMLDRMTTAVQADEYTQRLFDYLMRCLQSIEIETRSMLGTVDL